MNDFDVRQLARMKALIESYNANELGLSGLISNQWALIDLLEGVEKGWIVSYQSLVNNLEMIHSCTIQDGRKNLSAEDEVKVGELLKHMYQKIEQVGVDK